jgi:hypothetical protein
MRARFLNLEPINDSPSFSGKMPLEDVHIDLLVSNFAFKCNLYRCNAAYVGAQGQMSRGMGAGGLILGIRRQCSAHTSGEIAVVTGSMQSAATASVQRQLSEHSTVGG